MIWLMNIGIKVALAMLFVVGVGGSWLALTMPQPTKLSLLDKLALSWLLGVGYFAWLVSVSLLLFGRMYLWVWAASAVVCLVAVIRYRRVIFSAPKLGSIRWPRLRFTWSSVITALLSAVIVAQGAYVLAASLSSSLQWDGVFVWAVKAKAIYFDMTTHPGALLKYLSTTTHGAPGWVVMSTDLMKFSNPEYPLGLPALMAWVFVWVGGVDEQAIKVIVPTFFISLLALLSSRLGRVIAAPKALLLVALLSSAPFLVEMSITGYADVPLAALFGVAAAFGAEYIRQPTAQSRYLTIILAASMILMKKEGLILAVLLGAFLCAALLLTGTRQAVKEFVIRYAVGLLIIGGPWLLFALSHGYKGKDFLPITLSVFLENKSRLPRLVGYMCRLLQTFELFGYVWPVVVIFALARVSQWKRGEVIFLGLLCSAPLAIEVPLYVFSSWNPYMNHAYTSMNRLILHLLPVGVLLVGHLWSDGPYSCPQGSQLEANQEYNRSSRAERR